MRCFPIFRIHVDVGLVDAVELGVSPVILAGIRSTSVLAEREGAAKARRDQIVGQVATGCSTGCSLGAHWVLN